MTGRIQLEIRDKPEMYLTNGMERGNFPNRADQAVVECSDVLGERCGLNGDQSQKQKV